jgi:hypothetical protein
MLNGHVEEVRTGDRANFRRCHGILRFYSYRTRTLTQLQLVGRHVWRFCAQFLQAKSIGSQPKLKQMNTFPPHGNLKHTMQFP